MRDPERIDRILTLVKKVWVQYPDLRLAQLILNCLNGYESFELYNVEDDILEDELTKVYFPAEGK